MGRKSEEYEMGYCEGIILGQIYLMSMMLQSTDEEMEEELDELIRKGVFSEYDRQQALFYIRLGIRTYENEKRERRRK